jgi:hypothetical protein
MTCRTAALRTRQPSRSAIIVGLLVACLGATATAQTVVTGAIVGTLAHQNTTTLQPVEVLVRNIDTKREASARTDDEGRFRIVGLRATGNNVIRERQLQFAVRMEF